MPGRSLLASAGGNAARGRAVEPQSCSCAEPVLYCSCADHDRLRSIRGIPAPVFSCVRDRVAEFRVCVAAWQAGAAPRLSGALRGDSEVQCRTGAFWGNQGLTGASRFRGLLPALTAQFRAAALRCCARCSPLYWLLPAKTQLPPYGGLRESELKCLRSHPTPLRFYPQALSGAPALS